MDAVKSKKVFAVKDFRGLDKENKPLKVDVFRASDGKNFIIDSQTLKSRPSFAKVGHPIFFLEEDDVLIDWYDYQGVRISITKKYIYFNDIKHTEEEVVCNLDPFDFSGLIPKFQEEKSALFIFGLNDVYVVGIIDETYILYPISKKPLNPFLPDSNEFKIYEDLPIPYEPTLFIGENPLDDVNLLSRVSKYRLWASSPRTTEGITTYRLPTHYDVEKHGGYDYDIEFYKGKFDKIEAFPVFMGVYKENFFNFVKFGKQIFPQSVYNGTVSSSANTTLTDAMANFEQIQVGFQVVVNEETRIITEINETTITIDSAWDINPSEDDTYVIFGNPKVTDTFYPPRDFVYRKDGEEEIIVTNDVNITQKEFFETRIKNVTVFEYIMNLIVQNNSYPEVEENMFVCFEVPMIVNAIIRDEDDKIVETEKRELTEKVYLQIRKYEQEEIKLDNFGVFNKPLLNVTVPETAYPAYPEDEIEDYETYNELDEFNEGPYEVSSANNIDKEITNMARNYIFNNEHLVANDEKVAVKAKFYIDKSITYNFETTFEEKLSSEPNDDLVDPLVTANYPVFPTPAPTSHPIITKTVPINTSFEYYKTPKHLLHKNDPYYLILSPLSRTTISSHLATSLASVQSWLDLSAGQTKRYWYKVWLYQSYNPEPSIWLYQGISVYLLINCQKGGLYFKEDRFSVIYTGKVIQDESNVMDSLYEFDLGEDKNIFELKLKDYFYDYKNEPAIGVKVIFDNNSENYNMIAKSRFGITFGSENRLFLAGNTDFPHIDRFNVSNNLLGNNITNQSYELSYFPSRNYRVLGGRGAINGYVVAADNLLYITKQEHPNDDMLFIRERILDETGVVGYFEQKTNIRKTPLNSRCIVRFYNDVLILAKDGLYGIEISSNVLTNERMVKLRSGFINKDLVSKIKGHDLEKIFILENNFYMYIFIGEHIYVADSRYVDANPNSVVENFGYEIVYWKIPLSFRTGKITENSLYLLAENSEYIYELQDDGKDVVSSFEPQMIGYAPIGQHDLFIIAEIHDYILEEPEKYVFVSPNPVYHGFAKRGPDYKPSEDEHPQPLTYSLNVVNPEAFASIDTGDKLGLFGGEMTEYDGEIAWFEVQDFENRESILLGENIYMNTHHGVLLKSVQNKPLYINAIFKISGNTYFSLSPYKPDEVITYNSISGVKIDPFYFGHPLDPGFELMKDILVEKHEPIEVEWISGISDFGNNLYEKTSFKTLVYATRQNVDSVFSFGYRTMRRFNVGQTNPIFSNVFDFGNVDFNMFALSTFSPVGMSFPMKENNFLYIQFIFRGIGQIEINAIEIIFKLNRYIKTIG